MPAWKPLESVGLDCKGQFVRTVAAMPMLDNNAVVNQPQAPRKVSLPKGAIGFCYAAQVGVIHVGFTTDFRQQEMSPTRYPYAVSFNFRDADRLEILKG
jgi:hypothetical protein